MRRQSGESKIGCFFWILVMLVAGYAASKMLPVKIASAELYDFMDEQAKWAQRSTPEQIRKVIIKRAKELEIPLKEKDVKVIRRGRKITMEARYTVPVDFNVWVYEWNFHLRVERQIFLI